MNASVSGNDSPDGVMTPTGSLKKSVMILCIVTAVAFAGLLVAMLFQSSGAPSANESQGGASVLGLVSYFLLALAAATTFTAYYLSVRHVISPLTKIADHTKALAKGEAVGNVPGLDRNDELGRIATSLSTLSEADLQRRQAENNADEEHDRVMKLTEANNDELRRRTEETATAIAEIEAVLRKIVDGDLSCKINDPLAGDLDRLRSDINKMIDQYANTFRRIINSTESLNTGVKEIVAASDDLSVRTEKQASVLEVTATTVSQITETVEKSAEGAEDTRKIVEAAKNDAQVSGEIVERALSAMREIEESASEINQIITVIDEIAFQTNLLALNAGVEAARAGEAGQGFAVVASEVRALAQRSATAAKEIKDLIMKSSEQVAGGSKLVGETGDTLHRISNQVLQISSVVDEIANGAKEQHQSLNDLNSTVSEIDSGTQQNAAMAEEATAACHSLKGEAEELTQLMASFNVGGVTGRTTVKPSFGGNNRASAKSTGHARPIVEKPKPAAIAVADEAGASQISSPANELMSRIQGAFVDQQKNDAVPAKKNILSNTAVQEDDWEEF